MMDSEYLWDRGTGAVASVLCERRNTGDRRKKDEEYVRGGRSKKNWRTPFRSRRMCGNTPAVLTDSIVRIRAGFDGIAEESYSLVMTAWDDRMDGLMSRFRRRVRPAETVFTDGEKEGVIEGRKLRVVVEKEPFRICIYDKEGTLIHADIVELGYQEDSNHRRIHTSEISPDDCFYGFGEKERGVEQGAETVMYESKDAMGYNPKETDSPV